MRIFPRFNIVIVTCFLFVAVLSCQKKSADLSDLNEGQKVITPTQTLKASDLQIDSTGLSRVKGVIKTAYGNITLRFYPKHAPNTVTRILELVQQGFYDGLTFHRVIPNFVIQTGDPTNSGTGGTGIRLRAEFSNIQHIKGTIAMARGESNDSADSQFYITLTTSPHLDKKYTVFAQVSDGLSVLDKITKGDKILSFSIIR
ncbi:MAG: peptidylprolyl isomerase [Bacteriovoracaceae bacterium]|nr:peptidylprolyl isomerase [Bacteriovoracaceae bacterium]